jgi:hypothetical protein
MPRYAVRQLVIRTVSTARASALVATLICTHRIVAELSQGTGRIAVVEHLSRRQARRVALAAQGFTDPLPPGGVDVRHLRRVLGRTQLLQIDSVNVFARAHLVPAFSRLGPWPTALLDDLAFRRRELF